MPKGGFKPFGYTYGVGMEFVASSAKQVKNELKLNLDTLAKMIKSYDKILKIDPNADLTNLYTELRKVQSIVSGINNSDNSFSGFVDKGVLARISALESSLESISAQSEKASTSLETLKTQVASALGELKLSGQAKFPATFDNLFGNVADQSENIKNLNAQIKAINSVANNVERVYQKIGKVSANGSFSNDEISDLIAQFDNLKDQLSDPSVLNSTQISQSLKDLENIGTRFHAALKNMSPEQMKGLRLNDQYILTEIDDLLHNLEVRRSELTTALGNLEAEQAKFVSKTNVQRKSLGTAQNPDGTNYTLRAKVIPDTDEAVWAKTINDTIRNIEPNLKRVVLRPTFSKGKNVQNEIDGNLSNINHAIAVDLKVTDNIEQFNERIKNIDTSIKNAKAQLEKNGNFKIRFEYEEGGKFKDAAYKIINKFKRIESTFYIKNEKDFIQNVTRIKNKTKTTLKDIPANILLTKTDKTLAAVDNLRADIDKKIGSIDVKLNVTNIPQLMSDVTAVKTGIQSYYEKSPIVLSGGLNDAASGIERAANGMTDLSETSRKANKDLENSRNILRSLMTEKFNSPWFTKLGDINVDGKKVRGSTEKIGRLLQEYKTLQQRLPSGEIEAAEWFKIYPEAKGDLKVVGDLLRKNQSQLKQIESELNLYLQKQIAYAKSRQELAEKALQSEKQIVDIKRQAANQNQTPTKELSMSAEDASKKVKSLNRTISQQKKILKDVSENKFDSTNFVKLGEWDKEAGKFKKNSQEIKQLLSRYRELKAAREATGSNKVVGEEASIRGKLGAILREQKKHMAEIIARNKEELGSAKAILASYKSIEASKKNSVSVDSSGNISQTSKEVEALTAKLNKAREVLKLLNSKGIGSVGLTGLGDVQNRSGSKQNFNALIAEYDRLIAKRNELEAAGYDISHPEYVAYARQYREIEQQLSVIYKDQLAYTREKINSYKTQITNAQQLSQIERQQSLGESSRGTASSDGSSVVKLDAATLSSISKDATLRSIDGKVAKILGRLGNGVKVNGANVSINASNVSINGSVANAGSPVDSAANSNSNINDEITTSAKKAANSQEVLNRELTETQQLVKSGSVQVVSTSDDNVHRQVDTYRSRDKVSEVQSVSSWVKNGKDDPGSLEHVATIYKTNLEKFDKMRQDFIKALSKQKQLEQQIAMTDGPTSKLQAELNAQNDIVKSLEHQLSLYPELYTQESRNAAIIEATRTAQQEIAKFKGGQSDQYINKQNKEINNIVNNAQKGLRSMQYAMNNFELPMADSAISKVKTYAQLLDTLKFKQKEIMANPKLLESSEYVEGFNSLLLRMQEVQKEFTVLQKSSENFFNKIKNKNDIKQMSLGFSPTNLSELHEEMQTFANQAGVGTARLIEFNDAERMATFEIKNGKGHVSQLTVAYDEATNSLGRYTTQTKASLSETQKFFHSLRTSFKNVARYIISFGGIYRLFYIVRQGFTYVKDIDTALTELKKVTNETDEAYSRFLKNMSQTGSVIGATVANLTTMASEWARLGYSLKEAGKLAESTGILLNVSEFDDATKASEALISTMQAFKYTADESGRVVDILNEVGNNYAISSDGIATALQDSASALMEGGNNLEQAVALVAAANRVVQDPNSVGSALRTISLRLRGTSVKVLEEMGEETEGVVESVSKLQSKIKALSGVNIIADSGEYKDTYTILREIGSVWEDMSDIDQAALLELMAGKNRANTLSAILSNMKDLEGAYESATQAEGSALRENEAYLDSIQGRIDLFTNSVQTMWMKSINSEAVKLFVDIGRVLIDLVGNLGLVESLFAGILTYFSVFSKHKLDFASLFGIHNLESGWLPSLKRFGKNKSNNLVNAVLGNNPNDIKMSVKEFASIIQGNINDYVHINTSQIDGQIESVQNRLMIARQQLSDAQSKDWNYYKTLNSKTPAMDRDARIVEKQQEVKSLENQLLSLQQTRNNMVSSAADQAASSIMVQSVNKETASYQSLLSVLGEVKNTKLYIGNEQDAAFKIDQMSKYSKQGQVSLANYVSTLGDADIALKAYAASVKDGNYSLAGFQQFVAQHNAGLKASSTSAKAAALAHSALNVALSVGLSIAVSALISGIYKLANREKELAESAREAADASKELADQNKSLNDYKQQIIDLRKELDNNTLSERDAYDAREKLLTIEKDLIEKFGLEEKGINLVTGAINGQIEAIDKLQRQNAQQWLNDNQKHISKAIEFFESPTKGGLLDSFWEGENTSITNWGTTKKVADMIDEYADDPNRKHISTITTDIGQDITFKGSVEEVKKEVEDFQNWLGIKQSEMQSELKGLTSIPEEEKTDEIKNKIQSLEEDLQQLQDVYNDIGEEHKNWFGEGSVYSANKSIIEQTQYNTALTKYTDQYMKILQAQNDFKEAQLKGDKEAAVQALATLNSTLDSASSSAEENGQSYMVDFFNGIKDEFAIQTKELNLDLDLINNKSVRKSLSETLSWFKGKNAQQILQDYEINPDTTGFEKLNSFAEQYNMTIEELINSLVNLGYIQSGFNENASNVVKLADAYSKIATSVEEFNEVEKQSNEIIHDGISITKEHYESLKDQLSDITVGGEKLSDAIDENNGYIVKNAQLLKKLVAQSKNAKRATINVAKAQAQLEYRDIVDQMSNAIMMMGIEYQAHNLITDATFDNISAMREQIETLKQTIQQYALLEVGLSDAASAYDEYEAAKERDSKLTYDESFLEMIKNIDEGLLKNETGSEVFEYSVKAVVPEEKLSGIEDPNKKAQSVHDYIDGDQVFSRLFHVDEESGELDINADNVREFIKLSKEAGMIVGNPEGFELSDTVYGTKEWAEALGITEAAVLALLSATEDCDALWGNILTDVMTHPLDREINKSVDEVDDATKKLEDYLKLVKETNSDEDETNDVKFDSEYYNQLVSDIGAANQKLDENRQAAMDNAQAYNTVQAALSSFRGDLVLTDGEATNLVNSLKEIEGLEDLGEVVIDDGKLKLTDEQLTLILGKLGKITEPSVVQVQLRYDEISSEIDQINEYIENNSTGSITIDGIVFTNGVDADGNAIEDYLAKLTAEQKEIQLTYNITETSTEEQKSVLESYQEMAKNGVQFTVTANVTQAKDSLSAVSEEQSKINEKQEITITAYASTAEQALKDVVDQLDKINSKTITITVNKVESDSKRGPNSALGNAFASGTIGLSQAQHDTVVGELGQEMVVDPIKGTYYTVGDNGTEMVNLPKGAIIYNHKQTAELLKNGRTTRGKYTGGLSFARGNAYASYGIPSYHPNLEAETSFKNGTAINYSWDDAASTLSNAASSISNAADSISDAADEFEEVFDWVEVRLEEIDETLGLLEATLENAIYYTEKNNIIDSMIDVNNKKLDNLKAGYKEYADYAAKLLTEVPEKYRAAAQDGSIAIEKFVGEADEATLEAINNYREWAQKAADLKQQAEEIITTIRDLAIQKFDNAYKSGEVRANIEDSQTEKLQNAVDYDEERGLITSDAYYIAMMENSNKKIEYLIDAREAMQKELDEAVEAGQIVKGSNEWYELIDQMYQIDLSIDEATIELEEFQNAINDLYWDNFEQLTNRLDYLKDETQSLIDLMYSDDMIADPQKSRYDGGTVEYWTADDVKWTDEGIASLGLYAQQMEIAEYEAGQYAKAIDDLTKDYKNGLYSENEYTEKLNELKDAQYENIEAYYDAQDAIVDLNKTRVDSIKNGIEKEIEAYEELIEKKKEELDAEKDLYDFQKSTTEQQKNIAAIERQLAALANDNSLSANAKRKQLEAELAEAQYELQDTYYNRSVEDKQTALDQELEKFQTEKNEEIQKWDEYLTNVETLVAESLGIVQANASEIGATLTEKAEEYNLTVSDAILSPWEDGALAVSDYQTTFDTAMSSTTDQLDTLKGKWQEVIDKMAEYGSASVEAMNKENAAYAAATKKEPAVTSKPSTSTNNKTQTTQKAIAVGGKINASGAKIYAYSGGEGYNQYYSSDPIYTVLSTSGDWVQVRHHKLNSGVTGWFRKSDVKAYAKGTKGVPEDQLALLHELGDELVLSAGPNGKLQYITRGTAVIPHDISENLMELGQLDPSDILNRSTPQIGMSPSVVNNTMEITMSIAEVVHIDTVTNDTIPDLTKAVKKEMDSYMVKLNNAIKAKVR